MISITLCLVLGLLALSQQGSAFFRGSSNIDPAETNYTEHGPVVTNLTASILTGNGDISNSHWLAFYLSADNGHDYFAIACHAGAGPGNITTFVSLLDIQSKEYYGTNRIVPGRMPNSSFDIDGGGLRIYAASEDLYSTIVATSDVSGATFNLSSQAEGPNLYYGGSGLYYWGTDTTNQWAAPGMYVTGTITVNGTETNVIPEKSRSWLDRQWGPGAAINGWFWFDIILDNGVIVTVWDTFPITGIPKVDIFATILYPDGHHEIHAVDSDLHQSNPFVSDDTGYTYYADFQISIPTKSTTLTANIPVHVGEMTYTGDAEGIKTLYEGYAQFSGTFDGESVSGYGLSEQVISQV